jgi:signal transduction histidine kinase
MSEERLAVCSLLEGDEFAAISGMVDRVTHDMNNLLLPIVAYPPLMRREIAEGGRGRGMLDAIEQAGQSMLHMTRQLMAMRASGDEGSSQADLSDIARATLQALVVQGCASEGALDLSSLQDTVRVKGSTERIRLAVDALLRNAVEALPPSNGVVRVTVAVADVEAGRFGAVPAQPGRFGTIGVADNGEGFTEEVGKRLFDPFYTTRRARSRRGAGLGLSIAYRVAADHGGWLTYRGAPGEGASFTLYLPMA